MDELPEPVSLCPPLCVELVERRLVGDPKGPPKCVRHQLAGKVPGQPVWVSDQRLPEICGPLNHPATVLARRVDRGAVWVNLTRTANRVIRFQRESQGIDFRMAVRAGLDRSVFLQLLPNRGCAPDIGLDRGNIRRRRTGRRAEHFLKQPDSPFDRRSLHPVRGHRQNAGMPQQTAPRRIGGQQHPAELVAPEFRQSVKPGQSGVQIREVGLQNGGDRLVGADQLCNEPPGFLPHRGFKAVNVILRKRLLGWRHRPQPVQPQPLCREQPQKTLSTRRIQKPVRLQPDPRRIKFPLFRECPQLVVRRACRQEIGKPHGPLHRRQGFLAGVGFAQKQKIRGTEQRFPRRPDGIRKNRGPVQPLQCGPDVRRDFCRLNLPPEQPAGPTQKRRLDRTGIHPHRTGRDSAKKQFPDRVRLLPAQRSRDLPEADPDFRALVEMPVEFVPFRPEREILPDVFFDLGNIGIEFVELGGDEVSAGALGRPIDP